jgi:hypothetical protein
MNSLVSPVLVRLVAVGIAVLLVTGFSLYHVSLIYLVLAFGHLALAFWYQREAGKWEGRRFWYGIALLVLLVVASSHSFELFLLFTNFIFSVHMMLDETHLLGGKPSLIRTLEGAPFVLLYTQLFAWALFGVSYVVPALGIVVAILLSYVVLSFRLRRTPDRVSIGNFAWGGIALALTAAVSVFGPFIAPYVWFYALGMVHFFIWYGEFFRKVAHDAPRKTRYLSRVLAMNIVGAILLVIFLHARAPVLALLFAPVFVNAWTVWHIITSIRGSTVRASFAIVR